MHTTVIQKRDGYLFDLGLVKTRLRIRQDSKDEEEHLYLLMNIATDYIETTLGKTLWRTKRRVVHNNNCFRLPFGPVLKIHSVQYHKNVLKEGEYEVASSGDSLEITVPFRWKSPDLIVEYSAGYSSDNQEESLPSHVPDVLKYAVMRAIEFLYYNNGNLEALAKEEAAWLAPYRTRSIG